MLPSVIQFARPLLLMALAPAIAAIWWRRRRAAGRRPGAPLRWTAGGLVLIALAGPELRCSGDPTAVVLLDASASQGRPATWDGPIPDGWTVERIRFAAGLEGRGGTLDRTRTDLAPALTMLAERDRPPTAAIIVSDGRFTDAETLEPLLGRMARRGTRFLWVGRAGGGADARVTDLTAAIGADGVVEVTATVAADAAMTRTVAIGWGAGGEPVATGRVRLEPGEPSTVAVLTTRPDGRLGWLRAQLLEDDLLTANNRLVLPVRSTAPTVLWVAAADAAAPTAPDDWRVRQAAFEALPADPSALLAYDAIAVVDASGEALSAAQRAALAGYVNLGGGLVLIGAGPYGPRGRADPLNGVLPLRIEPRPRRPLDVTVLLDASGSMAHPAADGGGRKFDLVRRAVMAMAREGLREGDHLRVFTFAAITVERFKRHVTAADLADLGEILRKVEPAGASWINTALHRAWDRTGSPSADRVVLVFGDLRTGPFDADRWARRLSAAGVHLAVVAVGDGDADGPLKRLADEAGGWFECRADVAEAGALLGRLLDETRRTPLIRRVDVVRPTGLVFGREWITLPAVDARLAAEARPPSEVLAVAGDEAPLLACRDGAGRVVHLAAPLEGPHNRTWRTAVDARALLAAAVGWVRPPAGDGRYGGELRREGARVTRPPASRSTLWP